MDRPVLDNPPLAVAAPAPDIDLSAITLQVDAGRQVEDANWNGVGDDSRGTLIEPPLFGRLALLLPWLAERGVDEGLQELRAAFRLQEARRHL
jgi:hypothetical protein